MSETLNMQPEFNVELVTGSFERTRYDVVHEEVTRIGAGGEEKTFIRSRLVPIPQVMDKMIVVKFPKGHSVGFFLDDKEELTRYGLLNDPRIVNVNGESELIEEAAPKRGRKTGGISTIDED